MPITVQHALPPEALGKLAFETGAGMRQERKAQEAKQDLQKGREFGLQVAKFAADQRLAEMQLGQRQQQMEWTAARQQQQDLDEAQGAIDTQLADFAKASAKQRLTPEGQTIYRNLASKWKGIQKNWPRLNPVQQRQVMGQFRRELAGAGLENHVAEQPTMEEYLAANLYERPDGATLFRQPDGKLEFRPAQVDRELLERMRGETAENVANINAGVRAKLQTERESTKKARNAITDYEKARDRTFEVKKSGGVRMETAQKMIWGRERRLREAKKARDTVVKAAEELLAEYRAVHKEGDLEAQQGAMEQMVKTQKTIADAQAEYEAEHRKIEGDVSAAQRTIAEYQQEVEVAARDERAKFNALQAWNAKVAAEEVAQAAEEAAKAAVAPPPDAMTVGPSVRGPGGAPFTMLPGDMPDGAAPGQPAAPTQQQPAQGPPPLNDAAGNPLRSPTFDEFNQLPIGALLIQPDGQLARKGGLPVDLSDLPRPKTKAAWEALKPGTWYVTTDGLLTQKG